MADQSPTSGKHQPQTIDLPDRELVPGQLCFAQNRTGGMVTPFASLSKQASGTTEDGRANG
jgi:hypothetical protein